LLSSDVGRPSFVKTLLMCLATAFIRDEQPAGDAAVRPPLREQALLSL
jgi:hypothetical protein